MKSAIALDQFFQDLRVSLRTLLRRPGFTIVVVCALAMGIGANTAIFSVVYGVLMRSLPYPDADRIAVVYARFSPQGLEHGTMSMADYLDWRTQNQSFENPSIYCNDHVDITAPGEPEPVTATYVTAGYFDVFKSAPLLGKIMQPGDDAATAPHVVVLSESLWRRHFAGRRDILGHVIQLDDAQATIIGVMPASFRYPADSDLWISLPLEAPSRRGPFLFTGIARLKPGVSFRQAQTETDFLGRRIEAANPASYSRLSFPVVPLRESIVGDVRRALLVIFGAVLFVLLIATANVANLLLARAAARTREIAVRTALGAGRPRIIAQLLTESILLALMAGALGLALAYGGIQVLQAWNPGNLPRINDIHLNAPVLAFTFAIALLTGLLFGLAPALQISRTDPIQSLKEGGRGNSGSAASRRTRGALVVTEVALSLILLVGAGLLLRSFASLQHVNMGTQVAPKDVLTLQITRSAVKYAYNDPKAISVFEQLVDRVRQIPGVEAAALSTSLPPDTRGGWDTFQIEGRPWTLAAFPASTNPQVTAGYFRTLGIPLIKGRYFTDRDNLAAPRVCVISRNFAQRYWGSQNPIGQLMKEGGPDTGSFNKNMEIVGIVGDVKYTGLNAGPEAVYYMPLAQNYTDYRYSLVVRGNRSIAGLATAVPQEIRAFDPSLVVTHVRSLEQLVSQSVAQPRFRTSLISVFAAIALLLAGIGIYGVIAYSVAQRSIELGIRVAIGAQKGDILGLVIRQCMQLVGAGLAIGLLAAFALTRLMSSLLFAVSATDLVTFSTVALLLCITALVACYVPARRAMCTDPLVILRYE